MDSWAKGPFSATPSYAGVRLHEDALEETDGDHVSLRIPRSDARTARVRFGSAAERPVVQAAFGLALGTAGAWWFLSSIAGAAAIGRAMPLMISAAGGLVAFAGVWLAASVFRKRYYLALETAAGTRKLAFARGAGPRGLSVFLAAVEKRAGLTVAVPEGFHDQSRFGDPDLLPAVDGGYRTVRREVRAAGIHSFSFTVRADLLDFLVDGFADWLEKYLREGAEIRDRQTIVRGSFILLTEVRDGHLTILAPGRDPDQWIADLSRPLHMTLLQRYVADSYGLAWDPPSMLDLVSIEPAAGDGPVFMSRGQDESAIASFSGWFIWSVKGDHAPRAGQAGEDPENVVIALADLAALRPDLLQYLALPRGINVGFVGTTPTVLRGEERLTPVGGSYMDALLNGLEHRPAPPAPPVP